jgi:hypothetical protein
MHLASLTLALLAAQSAYGALFPRNGPVKNLQGKEFKKQLGDGVSPFLSLSFCVLIPVQHLAVCVLSYLLHSY